MSSSFHKFFWQIWSALGVGIEMMLTHFLQAQALDISSGVISFQAALPQDVSKCLG
jgi:hypothetical protein